MGTPAVVLRAAGAPASQTPSAEELKYEAAQVDSHCNRKDEGLRPPACRKHDQVSGAPQRFKGKNFAQPAVQTTAPLPLPEPLVDPELDPLVEPEPEPLTDPDPDPLTEPDPDPLIEPDPDPLAEPDPLPEIIA